MTGIFSTSNHTVLHCCIHFTVRGCGMIHLIFGSMADKIKIWQIYRYLEAGQIYVGLESSADTLEIWKLGRHNRDLEAKKSS